MTTISNTLTTGWSFAQRDDEKSFAPIEKVPTSVHVELLKAGKIPDPYKGVGEFDVQWVGEKDWIFQTTFSVTADELALPYNDLVFGGLDTYAEVFLNGVKILTNVNQFHAHRIDVKKLLRKAGEENQLKIVFESTFLRGKKEEAENGGKRKLWNGDSSRLYVRKAGYNYGWDWGPVLMTVGPYKPITVEHYTSRISDVRVESEVSEDLDVAVDVTIQTEGEDSGSLAVVLKDPTGKVIKSEEAKDGRLSWKFKKNEVELWYPIHYGAQPLYTVEITLLGSRVTKPLTSWTKKIGFRRARVVQEPLIDQPGTTFLFEINNVRVFCGGSNWIPADNFLTNVPEQRYRDWIDLLVAGNQNMIRVWAGGVFETEAFYNHCDAKGVLVWQDFMFGCGQYPAHDAFVDSVKLEAEQAVTQLRHHPSLVIFAGNNEDYQVAESCGLELDYSDETSDFRKTNFPARHIYERTLPEVVDRLSSVFYHRGSPYGGKDSTDRTVGDTHQWNVWHGTQEPWTNWDTLSSRFVAEFGMEGAPNIRTVDYWLDGNKSQRYPQSKWVCAHNKADGFERRLALYLVENFKHSYEMESYVYYTQVMQSDTLSAAYRLWRREWRGRGKEYTAGALVWQLNDCWPTTSWAICDYFLRPKPSYFTIKRELATYTVGLARKDITTYDDETTAAYLKINQEMQIWGTNSTLSPLKAKLEVRAFGLDSADPISTTTEDITLDANASTELFKGDVPGQPVRTSIAQDAKTIIIQVRLLSEEGEVLARYSDWPMPYKFTVYPEPYEPLKISVLEDGESVRLEASLPVKGVVLDVEGEEAQWSDQCIDLAPGDPQVVQAKGLKGRKVQARYIGDGTA